MHASKAGYNSAPAVRYDGNKQHRQHGSKVAARSPFLSRVVISDVSHPQDAGACTMTAPAVSLRDADTLVSRGGLDRILAHQPSALGRLNHVERNQHLTAFPTWRLHPVASSHPHSPARKVHTALDIFEASY